MSNLNVTGSRISRPLMCTLQCALKGKKRKRSNDIVLEMAVSQRKVRESYSGTERKYFKYFFPFFFVVFLVIKQGVGSPSHNDNGRVDNCNTGGVFLPCHRVHRRGVDHQARAGGSPNSPRPSRLGTRSPSFRPARHGSVRRLSPKVRTFAWDVRGYLDKMLPDE